MKEVIKKINENLKKMDETPEIISIDGALKINFYKIDFIISKTLHNKIMKDFYLKPTREYFISITILDKLSTVYNFHGVSELLDKELKRVFKIKEE